MFFLEFFESFFGSFQLVFAATCTSFLLKACFLFLLGRRVVILGSIERPIYFLFVILISNMFSDLAWILKCIQVLFVPQLGYKYTLFATRVAWIFFIIQYQTLALFLEHLVDHQYKINIRQKVFILVSFILSAAFIFIAVYNFDCIDRNSRLSWEPLLQTVSAFYVLLPLILPSLWIAIQRVRIYGLPLILRKQLAALIQGLIIPLLVADFIQMQPLKIRSLEILAHSYAAVSCTTILLTLAIYFCARRIFGLRFLNLKGHVQQPMNLTFIDDFKVVLERLGNVTNFRELGHITQSFFKETFNIPSSKTRFYLRRIDSQDMRLNNGVITEDNTTTLVETFLATHASSIEGIIKEERIFIYDEIDFTHFYDECEKSTIILAFLRAINADIFLPIYENDKLLAYIIVERHARVGHFYSNVERDEFIVFVSYLGNIINLLSTKNLDSLVEQEQNLRRELFHKHQEINQYKESVRSFLRKNNSRNIGILFYKNRQFRYGNQAAKELVAVNVNTQQGHPLVQALRKVAQQVESFRSSQSIIAKDVHGNSLVISGVPHLEQNTVIITVSYPDISDMLKHQLDILKNPTEWDYLLYLQTTQSGRLINQLIPGAGPVLLNFKIELLKIALSKQAIVLEMEENDLQPTVEILHHISMRDTLHTVNLQGPVHNFDVAVTLFGINPIFGLHASQYQQPLLERLDMVGTLFIKNIHFLDMETQEYLAYYIRYGSYKIFKSDQKVVSDVRIICSTNQNLSLLVQAGKFSKALFQELRATTVSMPSLLTLPEDELHSLAEGFTQQALLSDDLQHILALTEKEKNVLVNKRPASLQELKIRVQSLLVKKSKKDNIYQDIEFNPAYDITDPDLIEAARLGKQALKDARIMTLLWNKFQNQNKISHFLGVNRSSVNRRCKEYKLIE